MLKRACGWMAMETGAVVLEEWVVETAAGASGRARCRKEVEAESPIFAVEDAPGELV